MKVECGSKPGFSTSGWMATSTYQVNVISEDPFQRIIDQLKEKVPNGRCDEVDHGTGKRDLCCFFFLCVCFVRGKREKRVDHIFFV